MDRGLDLRRKITGAVVAVGASVSHGFDFPGPCTGRTKGCICEVLPVN